MSAKAVRCQLRLRLERPVSDITAILISEPITQEKDVLIKHHFDKFWIQPAQLLALM